MVVWPSPPFERSLDPSKMDALMRRKRNSPNRTITRSSEGDPTDVTGRRVTWANGVKKNYGAPRERKGKKGTIHN